MVHIVNNLAIPVSIGKSYSLYAGAQDAVVQWWYGHNAVGFLLTGGFLGLRVQLHLGRPTSSALQFDSGMGTVSGHSYECHLAGPLLGYHDQRHHDGEWCLEKTSHRSRPQIYFLSLAFYGLATFEGPMMAFPSVNVVSHFTDWTIGHVHSGALGWNAMITYGTFYFLVPRLVGTELYSTQLANIHFWMALGGTMLYIIAMWGGWRLSRTVMAECGRDWRTEL